MWPVVRLAELIMPLSVRRDSSVPLPGPLWMRPLAATGSRKHFGQVPHAAEVEHAQEIGGHPASPRRPTLACLPRCVHRPHSIMKIHNQFAHPLTKSVAGTTLGASIKRARPMSMMSGQARHGPVIPQSGDKTRSIQGGSCLDFSPPPASLLKCMNPFVLRFQPCPGSNLGRESIGYQAVGFDRKHMSHFAQLGFLPQRLATKPRIRIRCELLGRVGSFTIMEVVSQVPRSSRVLMPSAADLLSCPRFNQRFVADEMFLAQQALFPRHGQNFPMMGSHDLAFQLWRATRRNHRRIPEGVIYAPRYNPAEQRLVTHLVHAHMLASDGVAHVGQEGPRQLPMRYRGSSRFRIEPARRREEQLDDLLHHLSGQPQQMIIWHPLVLAAYDHVRGSPMSLLRTVLGLLHDLCTVPIGRGVGI